MASAERLPLSGRAAAVPKRFHLPVVPLTVDPGISQKMSRTVLLPRYHPIAVLCLTERSWALKDDPFYTPVVMGLVKTPEFSN